MIDQLQAVMIYLIMVSNSVMMKSDSTVLIVIDCSARVNRFKVSKDKSLESMRESLANIYDTSITKRIILPGELTAKFTVPLMKID